MTILSRWIRKTGRKLGDRVLYLLLFVDVDPAEVDSASLAGVWAVALYLNPGYLESSLRLSRLAERIPTTAWEIVFLSVFVLQAYGVLFLHDGNTTELVQRQRICRIAFALFGAFVWASVATLLLMDGFSVGGGVFAYTTIRNLWAVARLASLIAVDREKIALKKQFAEVKALEAARVA